MDPKVTLLGSRPNENGVSFLVFFALGPPWEPRLSTESLKVTLGAPKCLSKLSKIIEHVASNSSNKYAKKTPEYGYQLLVKKSKQQIGGHCALYFMFFWCSLFRQSTSHTSWCCILCCNLFPSLWRCDIFEIRWFLDQGTVAGFAQQLDIFYIKLILS